MMIDIGANLTDKQFKKDFESVVERSFAANVQKVIVTGTDLAGSRAANTLILDYNRRHPDRSECCQLYSTAGIHPHNASSFKGESTLEELRNLIEQDHVVAVGETGLDYDRMFSPKEDQLHSFKEHIKLEKYFREERGMKKPLFLHDRASHDDFLEILRENRPRGVVHCFTGNRDEVERYVELDMYIGVTGWINDERRNQELVDALPAIPLNRLLIETDAPYLSPNRKKIRRNEPCYLPLIAEKIASVLGISREMVVEQSTRNAQELFSL